MNRISIIRITTNKLKRNDTLLNFQITNNKQTQAYATQLSNN